jgi:uncharacterized protein (TIGR00730 family)
MGSVNGRGPAVCVYAGSSPGADGAFAEAAAALGRTIAERGLELVYGGGAVGLMGSLANGALAHNGKVVGIIPRFMTDVEWQHPGIENLEVVEDMRERKHLLLTGSDAVVALPGGCGTLEELFEAITLKRLGLYFNPIVLLNTRGYWTPMLKFMDRVIDDRFMNPEHREMWSSVDEPEQVLARIHATPRWNENARAFAAVR